jgi:hypothetical protein
VALILKHDGQVDVNHRRKNEPFSGERHLMPDSRQEACG